MEELSIEQKAKAYDEAIERAKGVIEQNPLMEYLKKGIEYIFPELKKSEDEKIREELIAYCQVNMGHTWHDIKQEEYIAWLEKLKEQKFTVVKDYRLRDTWEYLDEFVKKFGRYPKDADEISACIDYVIKRRGEQKPTKLVKWSEEDDTVTIDVGD